MSDLEAQQIIMAYAACTVVDSCNLCPLYKEERDRTKQRGLCREQTTPDKLREALLYLNSKVL